MAENNNTSAAQAAMKAAKTANSVKNAVQGTSRIVAGDVVGGAKDILKDENLRKIVLILAVVITVLPIMMFASLPSVLYSPSEDAYTQNGDNVSLMDIIKGLFKGTSAEAAGLDFLSDSTFIDLMNNGMKDEDSLKVVADSDDNTESADTDLNTAPPHVDKTMKNMIKSVMKNYEARHQALLVYIKKDYDSQPNRHSLIINDPLQSGTTTSDAEIVKLMSLYTVQTNDEVTDKTFQTFRDWLGEEDRDRLFNLWFMEKDDTWGWKKVDDSWEKYQKYKVDENGASLIVPWKVIPKKWTGTMLPQIQMDEVLKRRANDRRIGEYHGSYDKTKENEYFEEYKEFATSALSEFLVIDPVINREEAYEYYIEKDAHGKDVVKKKFVGYDYTYTITTRSVDDLCKEVVRFDEELKGAKEKNNGFTPLGIEGHREDYFKEMTTQSTEYFGVSSGGYGGSYGSGAAVAEIAYNEWKTGYIEYGDNGNKYGAAFNNNYQPWCNWFVSWCAKEANIGTDIIPCTGYTGTTHEFYRKLNLEHTPNDGYEPKPGDIVLHTPGGSGHVELVYSYDASSKKITTIGGNTGNNVEGGGINANGDCVGMHIRDISYWTYICEVPYPALSGFGEVYNCTKYTLSDAQINRLAGIISHEDDSPENLAVVASHMVNICEYWWNNGMYIRYKGDVYNTVVNGNPGWWAGASGGPIKAGSVEAIKNTICNGQRTLPPYVIEYDGFSEMYEHYSGMKRYLTIDGKNAPGNKSLANQIVDNAIPGKSHVLGSYGGEGTYFGATKDGVNGNVYYYNENYKQKLGY